MAKAATFATLLNHWDLMILIEIKPVWFEEKQNCLKGKYTIDLWLSTFYSAANEL